MIDGRITAACRKHGAKIVRDAAYSAMGSRTSALAARGLGNLTWPALELAA